MLFAEEQNDARKPSHSGTQSFRNSRQFRAPMLPIISLYHITVDNHRNMAKLHHICVEITALFPQTNQLLLSDKLLLRKI